MELGSRFVAMLALASCASGYTMTRYSELSSTTLEVEIDGSTSIESITQTYEITLTVDSESVRTIDASTSSTDLATMVDVMVPTGYGETIDVESLDSSRTYYMVELTYSECSFNGTQGSRPFTTTRELNLFTFLTGYLSPTSTFNQTAEFLDPTDVDPIHMASASFSARPTNSTISCVAETTSVDYRSYCSDWVDPGLNTDASQLGAPPRPTASSCGDLNPCCYGCYNAEDILLMIEGDKYLMCEDGRELELDGSKRRAEAEQEEDKGFRIGPILWNGAVVLIALAIPLMAIG